MKNSDKLESGSEMTYNEMVLLTNLDFLSADRIVSGMASRFEQIAFFARRPKSCETWQVMYRPVAGSNKTEIHNSLMDIAVGYHMAMQDAGICEPA